MRKITSLTLIISGIIELITSVVLYIIPSGRVAYWADYRLFGLSKNDWANIHITVGFLFLLMAVLHIYYNWRPMLSYLKNKAKIITVFTREFNIALLLSLFVTIGTLYNVPPMSQLIQLGEYFTESANEKYGEPPYGHAELSSLKMFCSKMKIDLASAIKLLQAAGVEVDTKDATIKEIAQKNKMTPQQLFEIIKPIREKSKKTGQVFPDSPFPGFGKKTIQEICDTFALTEQDVMAALNKSGVKATANQSVKEIGTNNSRTPMSIFEILKEVASNE